MKKVFIYNYLVLLISSHGSKWQCWRKCDTILKTSYFETTERKSWFRGMNRPKMGAELQKGFILMSLVLQILPLGNISVFWRKDVQVSIFFYTLKPRMEIAPSIFVFNRMIYPEKSHTFSDHFSNNTSILLVYFL